MIINVAKEWISQEARFRDLEKLSSSMPVPTEDMSERLLKTTFNMSVLEKSLLDEKVATKQDIVALLDVGIKLLGNPDANELTARLLEKARNSLADAS